MVAERDWKRRYRRKERVAFVLRSAFVVGVLLGGVVVTSLVVRGRFFMGVECYTLYGLAETAGDSARVDSVLVVRWGLSHPVTCGAVRADSFPAYGRFRGGGG